MTDLAGFGLVAIALLGAFGLFTTEVLAALGFQVHPQVLLRLWRTPQRARTRVSKAGGIALDILIVLVTQVIMVGTVISPVGSDPTGRQAISVIELIAAAAWLAYLSRGAARQTRTR